MSFLGSIGTLMKGTVLEDLLSEVYTENSVTRMMSGKAIARVIRGQILVESSFMSTWCKKRSMSILKKEVFLQASTCYHNICKECFNILTSSILCKEINDNIARLKTKLREQSRTSELWLFYMDYICIVKAFIFAGNYILTCFQRC